MIRGSPSFGQSSLVLRQLAAALVQQTQLCNLNFAVGSSSKKEQGYPKSPLNSTMFWKHITVLDQQPYLKQI